MKNRCLPCRQESPCSWRLLYSIRQCFTPRLVLSKCSLSECTPSACSDFVASLSKYLLSWLLQQKKTGWRLGHRLLNASAGEWHASPPWTFCWPKQVTRPPPFKRTIQEGEENCDYWPAVAPTQEAGLNLRMGKYWLFYNSCCESYFLKQAHCILCFEAFVFPTSLLLSCSLLANVHSYLGSAKLRALPAMSLWKWTLGQ